MTTQNQPLKPAGERLQALREERGLTKTQVGLAAGCSRYAINLYEQGKREPKASIAYRLYRLTRKWGAAIKPTEWERCA